MLSLLLHLVLLSAAAAFSSPQRAARTHHINCNGSSSKVHVSRMKARPSTALFHKRHIQITNNKQRHHGSSSSSAVDRLRVDLMRNQLSCNLAEQRARRLEVELRDERRRCDALKDELERARRAGSAGGDSNGIKAHQSSAAGVKGAASSAVRPTAAPSASTPFTGNSFDDLPPFAAALAANAEREEMEKRRRLGLVLEDEIDDDIDQLDVADLDAVTELALNLEVIDQVEEQAVVAEKNDLLDNTFAETPEVQSNTTAKIATSEQLAASNSTESKSTVPMQPSSTAPNNSTAYTNLFSTINNSTINQLNSQYTPQYINDDIQTLRQNCILLTHQRATLQHKLKQSESQRKSLQLELKSSMTSERVLRGLQADWTRRLSETRKDMDAQREESKKQLRVKSREWKTQQRMLEQEIQTLSAQCDELNGLLENQNNITFVMGLFCQLAKHQFVATLRDGRHRIGNRIRYGNSPHPHPMLTVGGADGQQIDDRNHADNRFSRIACGFSNRIKSMKQRIRQKPSIQAMTTNAFTDGHEPTTADSLDAQSSTIAPSNVSEQMPLLIRKNRRKSKLSQPTTVFQRRVRNADADALPYFMKMD